MLLVLSLLATPSWLQTLSHGVDTTSGAPHFPTQTLTSVSTECSVAPPATVIQLSPACNILYIVYCYPATPVPSLCSVARSSSSLET